jgi:long-chain acyl-CoA synthetase
MRRVLRWGELEFPSTTTGKVIRRQVARWASERLRGGREAGGRGSSTGGVGAGGRGMLLEMIAEVTGERVGAGAGVGDVGVDALRLSEELHLDSLGRVQLQSALEQRLGVELEDDAVARVETVGELRAMVERRMEAGDVLGSGGGASAGGGVAAGGGDEVRAAGVEVRAEEQTYPRWPWGWLCVTVRVAWIELGMRPLVWVLGAPRVVREAELPEGPVLIVANHVTAYDGALVLYALPGRLRRRVAIAMQGEMLLDLRRGRKQGNVALDLLAPAGYWLITTLFNVFPLPQTRGFRRSFAHAGEAMDRGYSVMVFPEGARSLDGRLHGFRQGIGLLAEESQVPVVPVALVGLYAMTAGGPGGGKKAGWFHSGRLEVRVGAAIAVEEGADAAGLTKRLEDAVRRLVEGGEG